ncbi:unnamed protein product, partial [Rotaria sp. Silwood1]
MTRHDDGMKALQQADAIKTLLSRKKLIIEDLGKPNTTMVYAMALLALEKSRNNSAIEEDILDEVTNKWLTMS